MKVQAERAERKEKVKTPLKKSATNFNKSEDKMIESLRDIQSTLRNKLQVIQQEDKPENNANSQLLSTQQRFNRKTNEEIVKALIFFLRQSVIWKKNFTKLNKYAKHRQFYFLFDTFSFNRFHVVSCRVILLIVFVSRKQ